MHLRILRLLLGFAVLTWGVSILGVVLGWSTACVALQGLGAQPIAYDRVLDYWPSFPVSRVCKDPGKLAKPPTPWSTKSWAARQMLS